MRECFKVGKANFSTKLVLAMSMQLPPLIIMLQTLLFTKHRVWNKFSLWLFSSSLICRLRTCLATNKSPTTALCSSSTSSKAETDGVVYHRAIYRDAVIPPIEPAWLIKEPSHHLFFVHTPVCSTTFSKVYHICHVFHVSSLCMPCIVYICLGTCTTL